MGQKKIFIVNPTAGQGAGKLAVPVLTQLVKDHAIDSEIVISEYAGHAILLAKEAADREVESVIAVGGDGTSNEVLNGLMQSWSLGHRATKLGLIGIGRGNDFAYGFGIPHGLEEGLKTVLKQNEQSMDVGLVTGGDYPQGRYFGNGVGIGFDAVVGFEAVKLTRLHGFMNYLVAALRTIFLFFNAPIVKVDIDNESFTQPALMVSIMNGRRMGGMFMMAPESSTHDGLLDLCIAGQLSRIGILTMIPRFVKGTQATQPAIKTARSSKIHITAQTGSLPTHADGETICTAGHELTIEIIKQPIKILHA